MKIKSTLMHTRKDYTRLESASQRGGLPLPVRGDSQIRLPASQTLVLPLSTMPMVTVGPTSMLR
jgi:hypothetical protein